MSLARTFYHPLHHIWIRAKHLSSSKTAGRIHLSQTPHRILEIGLTERGLEDIGDISSVEPTATRPLAEEIATSVQNGFPTAVSQGDELFRIHYDGHSITSADELYHTVWETFSDHRSIFSPISGRLCHERVREMAKFLEDDGMDENTVLVEIAATETEWEQSPKRHGLVTEPEYWKIVRQTPRGAFYE